MANLIYGCLGSRTNFSYEQHQKRIVALKKSMFFVSKYTHTQMDYISRYNKKIIK